jgi:hypothetical protein
MAGGFSQESHVVSIAVLQNLWNEPYYAHVERQATIANTTAKPIRSLGIDELSLKKSTASSSR